MYTKKVCICLRVSGLRGLEANFWQGPSSRVATGSPRLENRLKIAVLLMVSAPQRIAGVDVGYTWDVVLLMLLE